MVTHEWMVKPMRQTDWIDGRGLLVWLAEVFSALGTGLYLVSLFVDNWWGALAGWSDRVFKLPLHLLYLGKPLRFWRAIPPFTKAWRTSWIARGMFFTLVFAVFWGCPTRVPPTCWITMYWRPRRWIRSTSLIGPCASWRAYSPSSPVSMRVSR